jgi:hypothetical protein
MLSKNISNKLTVVWYHHGEWSEESLQVIGQLCTTGIARVHCNKSSARLLQLDLATLKHELRQLQHCHKGNYTFNTDSFTMLCSKINR